MVKEAALPTSQSSLVGNIGRRIAQLREVRGLTQSQLTSVSRVSRSYVSRIESGKMTPSLGTLEKISAALDTSLDRFFVKESDAADLLEDKFVLAVRPYLRQLEWVQWESLLKRLRAISGHVEKQQTLAG
jgi:transcriptional regulator with XRE-family HTH domain